MYFFDEKEMALPERRSVGTQERLFGCFIAVRLLRPQTSQSVTIFRHFPLLRIPQCGFPQLGFLPGGEPRWQYYIYVPCRMPCPPRTMPCALSRMPVTKMEFRNAERHCHHAESHVDQAESHVDHAESHVHQAESHVHQAECHIVKCHVYIVISPLP